jgi:ribosomal protein S18 acetylase RimI-like enzyme
MAHLPTAKGDVTIRYSQDGDAPALLAFINALSAERTFVLLQGEQLTLEQEEDWLRARLAEHAAGDLVHLVVVAGDRVVGSAGVGRGKGIERHVGTLGISLAADYRGLGLGSRLLQAVLEEAECRLDGLRMVQLHVFGNNELALRLYEKHGFIEFGRLPGGVLYHGQYVDGVSMFRLVEPDPSTSDQMESGPQG